MIEITRKKEDRKGSIDIDDGLFWIWDASAIIPFKDRERIDIVKAVCGDKAILPSSVFSEVRKLQNSNLKAVMSIFSLKGTSDMQLWEHEGHYYWAAQPTKPESKADEDVLMLGRMNPNNSVLVSNDRRHITKRADRESLFNVDVAFILAFAVQRRGYLSLQEAEEVYQKFYEEGYGVRVHTLSGEEWETIETFLQRPDFGAKAVEVLSKEKMITTVFSTAQL